MNKCNVNGDNVSNQITMDTIIPRIRPFYRFFFPHFCGIRKMLERAYKDKNGFPDPCHDT